MVAGWRTLLVWLPAMISVIAIATLILGGRRPFITASASVVISIVIGSALLVLPALSERLSLKSLSIRAARSLKPGERVCFYVMKEFAPVFYAEGRVVCGMGGGTVMNALNTDALIPVLEQELSLLVFTTSNWVGEIESDARLRVESLDSQGRAVLLRVSLKDG